MTTWDEACYAAARWKAPTNIVRLDFARKAPAMTIRIITLQLIQRDDYQRGLIMPNTAQRPQTGDRARELADALGPFRIEDDRLLGWSPFTHVISFETDYGFADGLALDRVYYLCRLEVTTDTNPAE